MSRLRGICCVLLTVFFAWHARADHHEDGFEPIFDGKSLEGWEGKPEFWSVQDGAITGETTPERPTPGNTFLIWHGGDVGNFALRLKYRIFGGNSGIQYRSRHVGDWVVSGYQADIDSQDTYSGILYEEKGRGILAQRGQLTTVTTAADGKHQVHVVASLGDSAEINRVINKEEWNEYLIVANGNQIMHVINGRVTCQVVDQDPERARCTGILALQLHAGPPMRVQFKEIRLKPLGP